MLACNYDFIIGSIMINFLAKRATSNWWLIFNLNWFNLSIYNLVNEFINISRIHLVIINLAFIRLHYIAFLRWSGVLEWIFSSFNTFLGLNQVMLCSSILHRNESPCRWTFIHSTFLVKVSTFLWFIIKLVLKLLEQLCWSYLGPTNSFHFFPNIFNVKI